MSDLQQLNLNLVPTTKEDLCITSLGSAENSPNANNNSESIEVLATPSNNHSSEPLQESTTSVSSNNTDIWVLENQYDYYVRDKGTDVADEDYIYDNDDNEYLYDDDDLEPEEQYMRSIDFHSTRERFTVVHKSQKPNIFGKGKKLLEKMKNVNSEYDFGKQAPIYSGTDSDVEVLVEGVEIVEPGWSADDLPWSTMLFKKEKNVTEGDVFSNGKKQAREGSSAFERYSKDGLDHRLVEEQEQYEGLTNNTYDNLNRTELLEVIKQQELHIKTLEAELLKHQKAQQKMCEHVNALRLELSEMSITPSVLSKQLPNQL